MLYVLFCFIGLKFVHDVLISVCEGRCVGFAVVIEFFSDIIYVVVDIFKDVVGLYKK